MPPNPLKGETTMSSINKTIAVAAKSVKPGIDFFPLTVNYQEKTYAAGRIPGGFFNTLDAHVHIIDFAARFAVERKDRQAQRQHACHTRGSG